MYLVPYESHRYSRRFPEFYVFGSPERVIDTPAGFPSFMCCQLSDNGLRGHLPRVYIELLQRISPYRFEPGSLYHSPFSAHSLRKFLGLFPSSEFWFPKGRRRYSSRLRAISTQPEFLRTLSLSFPIGTPRALLNRCNPTTGPKPVSRSITGRALCPVRPAKSAQTPLVTAPAEARDRTDRILVLDTRPQLYIWQLAKSIGHYPDVQYMDIEPSNTPEIVYIALHGRVRPLLPHSDP